MSEKKGADTLKRISELEEQLEKRFLEVRKKANELVSRSTSEAARIIEQKKRELAEIRDINTEADNGVSEIPSINFSTGHEVDPQIVSELAENLFQLLIERKSI